MGGDEVGPVLDDAVVAVVSDVAFIVEVEVGVDGVTFCVVLSSFFSVTLEDKTMRMTNIYKKKNFAYFDGKDVVGCIFCVVSLKIESIA